MDNAKEKIYLFGTKAAPLTLAHEAIIKDFLKKAYNEDALFIISVAPSKYTKAFKLPYHVLRFVSDEVNSSNDPKYRYWYNCNVKVEEQEDWSGFYKWAKSRYWYDSNKEIHLIIGEDEVDSLKRDEWKDSKFILNEWKIEAVKRDNYVSASAARDIFYRDPIVEYFYVKKYISRRMYDQIKLNGIFWQNKENYRADENAFLKQYDSSKFPKPSVTVDNLVWKYDDYNAPDDPKDFEHIKILLIRRGGHPYRGYWALPGGFFDVLTDVDIDSASKRELKEETGIENIDIMEYDQFKAYSDRNVDPRDRIVDIVTVSKVSWSVEGKADDDAVDLDWFYINELPRMAFNHEKIIREWKDFVKTGIKHH